MIRATFIALLLFGLLTPWITRAETKAQTAEGVKRAKEVIEAEKQVNDLKAILDKGNLDMSEKSSLENALKDSQAKLDQKISRSQLEDTRSNKEKADERFAGFNFGVALGVIIKAGERDLVQSASLDPNGIVRIDRDNNTTANLILESHYFFTPDSNFFSLENVKSKDWGHGPFIAVQPGTENIVQSVGCGWMLGFKRSSILAPDLARDRGDSFNIGLGVMVNPNAKVLGDGITKNQVLPAGETSVRLRTTTEMGWLITFSYSF